MKLEQKVCSIESSKKLKKLGVKQESSFYWVDTHTSFERIILLYENESVHIGSNDYFISDFDEKDVLSAFTVAELGEILPKRISIGIDSYHIEFAWLIDPHSLESEAYVFYVEEIGDCANEHWPCVGKTEAEARAKMLIYLLENNILKLGAS